MEIELNLVNIVELLSVGTAFVFGLFFISSKTKNNFANIYLSLFLWSLATEVLSTFFERLEYKFISTGLITLPLLFFYIIKTLNYEIRKVYLLLLLIPLLLKISNLNSIHIYNIYDIILLIVILIILKRHKQSLNRFYSNVENRTLNWVKTIVYIYLFFYCFWVIEDLIRLQNREITIYFPQVSSVMTLLMIYWVGYKGFSQPEIFSHTIKLNRSDIQKNNAASNNNSYKNDTSEYFNLLTKRIQQEKLFLNSDINLYNLSKQLNVKEKELTKLIKTHTDKNFYHFMNQFRVQEFKTLLTTQKAKKLSLLGLAKESGFNSKSAFYNVFKTIEGVTPKEYLNRTHKSK